MNGSTCPQCDGPVNCQVQTGSTQCWCMAWPAVLPVDGTNRCLCQTCLSEAVQRTLAQRFDNGLIYRTAPAEAIACQTKQLIEGIDYTVEQGLYVFSRWFHLKRGQCCGHACRHCPYGHANVSKPH